MLRRRPAGEPRLPFARSFCAAVIRSYWFAAQKKFGRPWPLPDPPEAFVDCALDESSELRARAIAAAAAHLDPIAAGYLAGIAYMTMLPEDLRARLGVYYTPPALVRRLLQMATRAGVDWQRCRVVDPASGGGAFLAPVAARILRENRRLDARALVEAIATRVRGFEIDPFAAWAAQVFLEAATMEVCRQAGRRLPAVVTVCDSLRDPMEAGAFDLVIGNPPYGRVRLEPEMRERYRRCLYGHANLYGLFTDLAVRLARPGGVIAYVTPASFLAGEYFKALRRLLAEQAPPAEIEFVAMRKGVFHDVLQETLLATYRREQSAPAVSAGDPWLIPRTPAQNRLIAALRSMPHRLRDYGYRVSTGPLVWNRHKSQLAAQPADGTLPLIWAECVSAGGKFRFRAEQRNHQPYFRPRRGDEWLITRQPCVLLQRTTAKEQNRRLISAELPGEFLAKHGAAVIENHLNMIRPVDGRPRVPADVLAALLNTCIADAAFRCLSGSVAVSAYELEALPLPPPESLDYIAELLQRGAGQEVIERACARLYRRISSRLVPGEITTPGLL